MEDKKKTTPKGGTNTTAKIPATLYAGLAHFQANVPAIKKANEAGSGNFTYKYGSLPDIMETIKPHMAAAGLGFTQPIILKEGKEVINTIVFHVEDEDRIESTIELPAIEFKGMNVVQSKGSIITYLRRYSLMSILGIVAEEDDNDGAGETTKKKSTPAKATTHASHPVAPEKDWINPKVGGKDNPVWTQAVKYLADGGKIDEIKKKYRIGKANEEKLLNDALTFDDLPFDREAAEIESTTNPDEKPNDLFDQQGETPPA